MCSKEAPDQLLSASRVWVCARARIRELKEASASSVSSLRAKDCCAIEMTVASVFFTLWFSSAISSARCSSARLRSVMSMNAATAPRGRPAWSSSGRALPSRCRDVPSGNRTSSSKSVISSPRAARCTGSSSGPATRPSTSTSKPCGRSPATADRDRLEPGDRRRRLKAVLLPLTVRHSLSSATNRTAGIASIMVRNSAACARSRVSLSRRFCTAARRASSACSRSMPKPTWRASVTASGISPSAKLWGWS